MSELDRELEALRKETREKLDEEARLERRIEELSPKPAPVREQEVERELSGEREDEDELSSATSGKPPSPLAIVAATTGGLIVLVALWNIVFAPLVKLAILLGVVFIVGTLLVRALGKKGADDDDGDSSS